MLDLEYFKTINGTINCENKRVFQQNQIAKKYDTSYDNTLSTYQILKNTKRIDKAVLIREGIEKKEIPCIIDYKKVKEFLYNSMIREIWTDLNTVLLGDCVEYVDRNDRNERTYLIISIPEPRREYCSCVMQECNSFFKAMVDGKITSISGIFSDKVLLGLQEKTALLLPNNTYMLTVQNNTVNRNLKELDRIMIDGDFYRIVGRNRTSLKGLITIKLESDTFNPNTDNKVLGIADYYKKDDSTPPVISNPSTPPILTIASSSEKIYKGKDMLFELKMSDNSPIPIGGYEWSIDKDLAVLIPQDDKSVILRAKNTAGKLKLYAKNINLTVEKDVEVYTRIL